MSTYTMDEFIRLEDEVREALTKMDNNDLFMVATFMNKFCNCKLTLPNLDLLD